MSLIPHFPTQYQPTFSQTKLLEGIQEAFKSGKKFVICCAPTGVGKSMLAKTVGNSSSLPTQAYKDLINSYNAFRQDFTGYYNYAPDCLTEPPFGTCILTITKSLQDQYAALFSDIDILKGKTNYTCTVDTNYTVDTAPCILTPRLKAQCWDNNTCPYYSQRNKSLTAQTASLNYKMFLALPEHVRRKEYLICDEASELEEELISKFSLDIQYEILDKHKIKYKKIISDRLSDVRPWISDVSTEITDRIDELTEKILSKTKKQNPNDKFQLNYLRALQHSIELVDQNCGCTEYIVDRDSKKVNLTPLRANYISRHLFNSGDKILLMSATIVDHVNFAKSFGISDYEYIEVESEFDPKKSPIYFSTKVSLNYSNLKQNLPVICKQIEAILEEHPQEKGIIHSHSHDITAFIKQKLGKDPRLLFRDSETSNEDILEEHFTSKYPTVLVSPSLTHGIDLKDDACRFIVLCKAPYMSLASKRIKKLFDQDKQWFEDKCLNVICQSTGRGTRSQEDYCKTYCLDGNIARIVQQNINKLPKYFQNRLH
jgi:Rad3-related DNA helicase